MPADLPAAAPASDPLATALRRLRWPMVIVWVLAVVLLDPFASGLSKVTNDTAAAYLPPAAPSTHVALLQEASQPGPGQPESEQAIVVFARRAGLTAGDLAAVASARAAVNRLASAVPGLSAPSPSQRSADGQAEIFTASVTALSTA